MDSNTQSSISAAASSSRKRERENETPSQRHKREKAAERQRRKRERDRNSNGNANSGAGTGSLSAAMFSQAGDHQNQQVSQAPPPDLTGQEMSPEERARRDKVRAAARERQRKHRALVKDRKMRELGIDMGNDITEVQYRVNGDGQYQQVLAHELQHNPHGGLVHHEPPFPHGQPQGGQTFASTLLLSFSCAPLLKQHLLTTLSMTNEELASLQPMIAEAWDHWDHQRRLHYAQQAADPTKSPGSSNLPAASSSYTPNPPENAASTSYSSEHGHQSANDFRSRFQRPLQAPSPFRTFTADTQTTTPTSTGTSNGSGPPSDVIDPHLSEGRHKRTGSSDLGQARDEAEGVVGRLERR